MTKMVPNAHDTIVCFETFVKVFRLRRIVRRKAIKRAAKSAEIIFR